MALAIPRARSPAKAPASQACPIRLDRPKRGRPRAVVRKAGLQITRACRKGLTGRFSERRGTVAHANSSSVKFWATSPPFLRMHEALTCASPNAICALGNCVAKGFTLLSFPCATAPLRSEKVAAPRLTGHRHMQDGMQSRQMAGRCNTPRQKNCRRLYLEHRARIGQTLLPYFFLADAMLVELPIALQPFDVVAHAQLARGAFRERRERSVSIELEYAVGPHHSSAR